MRESAESDSTQHPKCARRQWLTGMGTAATLTLAGCLFSEGDPPATTTENSQTETEPPSSSAPDTDESDDSATDPADSAANLTVTVTAPETVATGIEDSYQLSVTNTGATATSVTYGVDARRPQMVTNTLTTVETTLQPDETQTQRGQFANWERGTLLWTGWVTTGETRVTTTASTTVELSRRPWGGSYRPVTGHVISVGLPTITDTHTETRADGTPVSLSVSDNRRLVVVSLQVRNGAGDIRRTPDAAGFHLRTATRQRIATRATIGSGTTGTMADLQPGERERWTLIYDVPADVTQQELALRHTGAGYYTSGGWQVHWS